MLKNIKPMKKIMLILTLLLAFIYSYAQDESPAINHSLIAFTVAEKDLIPENIAYDPVAENFYIGSTRKGKIIRISKNGKAEDFISPKQYGLFMVIGMKVDAKNRVLWACSSGGSNLIGYDRDDETTGRPAGLFKFDLDSGKLIEKYLMKEPGEVHFLNDLVLDKEGRPYLTHMFKEHGIYTVQDGKLQLFAQSDQVSYPNGITRSPDGRYLFVAHSEGISRLEIASRKWQLLDHSEDIPISRRGSADGLYFYKNTLIAVQPGLKTIRQLELDNSYTQITGQKVLEAHHPMMNNPTTGVLVEDTFYYVANAQFDSFNEDGSLFPMEQLYEVVILKLKL